MMWVIIFGSLLIAGVLGLFYLWTRFHRFSPFQRLAQKHKILSWLLALLPLGAVCCVALINTTALIVVLIHLAVIWVFCDLVGLIVRRIADKTERRHYPEGIAALALTACVLGAGWYLAHHVYETDYRFTTDKQLPNGSLRVVAIADLHLGITLDGEGFARELERVRALEPDLIVIAGDYVDDDSTWEDTVTATRALGEVGTTCGIYYSIGNHDSGYFNSRSFTREQLYAELEKNGITALDDEAVEAAPGVTVLGRLDKSFSGRKPVSALTENIDPAQYVICIDHQPNDYANEAAAQVDLVLSGHTHGGHIFPAGYIGLWIGANDRVYGTETRDHTNFVVTSGISGWAIPFKTGAVSEFCVIDIVQE
jgi:predicted MPP superfamily phosphohydrolase